LPVFGGLVVVVLVAEKTEVVAVKTKDVFVVVKTEVVVVKTTKMEV
jgi:hypothetical protein